MFGLNHLDPGWTHKAFSLIQKFYFAGLFWVLTFFYPVLHTEKYFSKGYVYFSMALLLLGSVYFFRKTFFMWDRRILVFLGLVFLWYLYLLISGYIHSLDYPEPLRRFYVASEILLKFLVPLLLIPFLYLCRRIGFEWFELIVTLAGLTSFVVLAYDFGTGTSRYHRLYGAPIVFGNLAMLSGVLAVTLGLFNRNFYKRVVLLTVGAGAIAASFYSGTRGGWIFLLMLPFLYLFTLRSKVGWRYAAGALVLAGVMSILAFTVDSPVKKRLDMAVYEFKQLLSNENYRSGSIGQRIAVWEVSIDAFMEHPITGIGLGNFYAYKYFVVKNGEAPENTIDSKHEHSIYMTVIASTGLIGLAFFIAVFGVLFTWFKQAAFSEDHQLFMLGQAGLIVLLAYLDFGLSESYLFLHTGAAAFFFLVSVILYLIVQREGQLRAGADASSV